MNGKVRTRIAPSPTGFITLGNMRTALFNYLFAKNQGGTFVLRVEDTDKERSKKEFEEDIFEEFAWLAITPDEGPQEGGTYAPYRQSERTELYKTYLTKLFELRSAYYCFCTPEELAAQRSYQMSLGEAPKYIGTCRNLSKDAQEKKIQAKESAVIRFIVEPKILRFTDLIRGEIAFDTNLLGDIVIAKDLETPLYNFTVVVDDFEMQITHVIRGEDHIANTQKQILLREALDLPSLQFAHLPLLLGPDRTKLSKRHGDTSLRVIRQEGYLPEAVINFLALLGWNPGDEKEIFSLEELIHAFSLKRIQKGAAIVNMQRLDWINGMYIRRTSLEELTKLCLPYLNKEAQEMFDFDRLKNIISLYHERLKKLSEITELTDFFFKETLEYSKDLLQWKGATDEQTKQMLERLEGLIVRVKESEWGRGELEKIIMPEAEKLDNKGFLLWPMRTALTGKKASAPPFEVAEILGKEKTLRRIKQAITLLS